MKLWKKGLSVMICAGLLAAACSVTALAAKDSKEKITSLKLYVESDIQVGDDEGDVTVTTEDGNYEVTDVSVVNDDGEWTSGSIPKVEVTLEASDGYMFNTMSKGKVSLKGSKATYVSSRRKDNGTTMIVSIKLGELESKLEIEAVEWEDENSPVARWEETDGARSYQVRLYRGSSSVGSSVTTSNETYNFASSITREGEYYFKVRAVSSNNKKGEWYESDYIYVDEELLDNIKNGRYTNSGSNNSTTTSTPGGSGTAQWKRNNIGWWYEYADGTYPTNGWLLINNVWYCFDASGYMRTGWIQAGDGQYYYCDTNSGAMLTNTWTPDNYYVGANGVWDQSKRR